MSAAGVWSCCRSAGGGRGTLTETRPQAGPGTHLLKELGSEGVAKLAVLEQQEALEGHKMAPDLALARQVLHQGRIDQPRPGRGSGLVTWHRHQHEAPPTARAKAGPETGGPGQGGGRGRGRQCQEGLEEVGAGPAGWLGGPRREGGLCGGSAHASQEWIGQQEKLQQANTHPASDRHPCRVERVQTHHTPAGGAGSGRRTPAADPLQSRGETTQVLLEMSQSQTTQRHGHEVNADPPGE